MYASTGTVLCTGGEKKEIDENDLDDWRDADVEWPDHDSGDQGAEHVVHPYGTNAESPQ